MAHSPPSCCNAEINVSADICHKSPPKASDAVVTLTMCRAATSSRDSALRGSLALSGRMTAETEHGRGLLDIEELQSLTPPPAAQHRAVAAGQALRASAHATENGSEALGHARHGSAASVLGDAVQHDLDALSAALLPPMQLPSPDSKQKGSPARMSTPAQSRTSASTGATTSGLGRYTPVRRSMRGGSPVLRAPSAAGPERGRQALGLATPPGAGRRPQHCAPCSRGSASSTGKAPGAPAGAATPRRGAGNVAGNGGAHVGGTQLEMSPQHSPLVPGMPRASTQAPISRSVVVLMGPLIHT